MQAYEILYYIYLVFFGVYVSMRIACGRLKGGQRRFTYLQVVHELMPTGVVLFFLVIVSAYQREVARNRRAEHQTAALESELMYAQQEIAALRDSAERTAIYRHDFRHHLRMIDGLLASGSYDQASECIRRAEGEVDALVPTRYCEHETVNLLLSAFRDRAGARGVSMNIRATLPKELRLPETELCTLLSNGLENALNAASALPAESEPAVDFYAGIKQNHLLIEIRNPYAGEIAMQDGIPLASGPERHCGCRSIQLIVQRRKGDCSFEACEGVFVLRIALPL